MPRSGAGGPPKGGPPALRFVRRIFPAVHAAGAASRRRWDRTAWLDTGCFWKLCLLTEGRFLAGIPQKLEFLGFLWGWA